MPLHTEAQALQGSRRLRAVPIARQFHASESTGSCVKTKRKQDVIELGQYIVADPLICHGKPTFKGTRIMVWQIVDDVADGHSWEFICNVRWAGRIPLAAVAEAVKLARQALLDRHGRLLHGLAVKVPSLAAA